MLRFYRQISVITKIRPMCFQLAEALQEVEVVRSHSEELQTQLEELQEEVSLQEARSQGDVSLLSELESSLTAGLDRKEITEEMESILRLLQPLTHNLSSTFALDVSNQQDGLEKTVHQLKKVAQTLAQACCNPRLNQAFVARTADQCGNWTEAQELRDQNIHLQSENAELMQKFQRIQAQTDMVQQAIRDRDDAIAKKNMMEAELVRSKNDMMCLNNQLLEAIQRKLELSQELEAWQDDIQIILNQQLRSQQQTEQVPKKVTSNGLSFFRRPSRNNSNWMHQSSTSSTWSSDSSGDKAQSPWRDWLRRGKGAQYGK